MQRRDVDQDDEAPQGDRFRAPDTRPGRQDADGGEAVSKELHHAQCPIEPVIASEAETADADDQDGDGHQPSEELMPPELDRVEAGPPRVQQGPAGEDAAEPPADDPSLAAVLITRALGRGLVGDGVLARTPGVGPGR